MQESSDQFEKRKRDHIDLALDSKNQTRGLSSFDRIQLLPEALPDLNLSDVSLESDFFGHPLLTPFLISSMTAGHPGANSINICLARLAALRGWAMGVGSQRRELGESGLHAEWKALRAAAPRAVLFGNIGISQAITSSVRDIQTLVDNLQAAGIFIHLNALQESLQIEGTPSFRGGLDKIAELAQKLSVPVIVKEVGCGISGQTFSRLSDAGVAAVDVAGLGGTHWGRLEGARTNLVLGHRAEGRASEAGKKSQALDLKSRAAKTFAGWGLSTVESLLDCLESQKKTQKKTPIWASGGVRDGLDAAKLLAIGAEKVGIAMPLLKPAMTSDEELNHAMESFEYELKIALFCSGAHNLRELSERKSWKWV